MRARARAGNARAHTRARARARARHATRAFRDSARARARAPNLHIRYVLWYITNLYGIYFLSISLRITIYVRIYIFLLRFSYALYNGHTAYAYSFVAYAFHNILYIRICIYAYVQYI